MSGLQFSLLKSNFTLGEDAYYIKRTQHVHYLGMPLHVSYKWLDVKNWTICSSLGGSLQIPVYGKTDEKYVVGPITSCTNHWHFIPSLQWSVSTGIGVQYKLATKWSVYIEPRSTGMCRMVVPSILYGQNIRSHLLFPSA